ncbi:hypothetical protein TNCV_4956781 [Trichonephila clavipes]|nr:hypothetical protein TNCV_4956781 [Trichonephila clavipes]
MKLQAQVFWLHWQGPTSRRSGNPWWLRQPSGQGIGSWLACHIFEPSTPKDPPWVSGSLVDLARTHDMPAMIRYLEHWATTALKTCRGAMHVKSVESSNILPLV